MIAITICFGQLVYTRRRDVSATFQLAKARGQDLHRLIRRTSLSNLMNLMRQRRQAHQRGERTVRVGFDPVRRRCLRSLRSASAAGWWFERNTLWRLIALSIVNVALAVWRRRLTVQVR